MKVIGWIQTSGTLADGVKAELVERRDDGTVRVKLLEPASSPGWKRGDVITIMQHQFKRRK